MSDSGYDYQPALKDTLENFFKNPTKENFPDIIETDNEYDDLDFKREWYEKSKLARHILAVGNSGGGVIVVGVEQNSEGEFESVGLEELQDEADFGNKIEKFIPDTAHDIYQLETFSYGDVYDELAGKDFQVLFVDDAGESVPLVATNSGSSITEGNIYIRRNTKSTEANYDEIQKLLQNRKESNVEKESAELHVELQELKTLYNATNKENTVIKNDNPLKSTNIHPFRTATDVPNAYYPSEGYDEFISNLIRKKKRRIESRLGVSHANL